MRNLDNFYIWWPTFVMSRTDAQNGTVTLFKEIYVAGDETMIY